MHFSGAHNMSGSHQAWEHQTALPSGPGGTRGLEGKITRQPPPQPPQEAHGSLQAAVMCVNRGKEAEKAKASSGKFSEITSVPGALPD